MADSIDKSPKIPTPAEMEQDKAKRIEGAVGFDDVLRALALGIAPTAPRLPEQAQYQGSQFGGYPKGFTSRLGMKGTLSFAMLRQIAERSPVLSAILSTRLHQRSRFARIADGGARGEVGLRVVHRRQKDPKFKVPEGFQALCREVEQMIEHPWRVYWDEGQVFRDVEPTFSSFSSKIIEDLLVINRPVIELGLDPMRVPRAFGAIDGANVIPTFQSLKYLTSLSRDLPKDFDTSYDQYRRTLQMVADKYKIQVDERTEHLYMLGGRPVAGFRGDELIIAPMFPSSDVKTTGYPKSLTERAVFIILSEIMAMTANSRYFEYGSMAEVILAMKGNYQDKHIKDLEQVLQGNMSGVPGMFRVPLIALPGGAQDLEVVQLKQNHRDMLFDIYIQKLTNLACAVFRMHPSEINEAPRAGDNSGAMNQASQKQQINMAQEQGLEAILEHEKQAILDQIVMRIDPDLRVDWEYGKNEQEQLTVVGLYGPITTVDERRMMMGLDPLGPEKGGDVIDNQYVQAKTQADQQAKQQEQGGEGAPPGAEGDDEEGDAGDESDERDDDEKGPQKKDKGNEDEDQDGEDDFAAQVKRAAEYSRQIRR